MRVFSLVSLLSVAGLACAATGKDVDVTVKFPNSNPFGRVQNGHSKNLLHVRLANHAGEEITITSVHGQYREAGGRQRKLRNTTTLPLRQSVLPGLASPLIPYKFHSENKIGEVGLRVWVDYLDAGKKSHTVLGYDGAVTIVEPPSSWFDLELLSLYLMLLALVAFAAQRAYKAYLTPSPVKGSKRAPVAPASPKADGKAYEDEWIPDHVLRQRKAAAGGKKEGYTSATSGEESEGAVKGKKAKGKK